MRPLPRSPAFVPLVPAARARPATVAPRPAGRLSLRPDRRAAPAAGVASSARRLSPTAQSRGSRGGGTRSADAAGTATGGGVRKTPAQLLADTQLVYSTSKPPWCQPWTITLTGSVAIGGAWLLFPSFPGSILAVGTTAAVSLWWWVFLIAYPQATLRYAAADERRAGEDDRR